MAAIGKIRFSSVGNTCTITNRRIDYVQQHRANAKCNSGQTTSDYYKVNALFPFVDHVVHARSRLQILTTSSRINSCGQTVDGNEPMDTRNQIEILEYYRKFLIMQESSYF